MYDFLIIGNGIAGLSAAIEIRKEEKEKSIMILSEEKVHTYWRTRLSNLIDKDFSIEDTYVKKDEFYKENKIEEKLNVKVEKIDRENKKVILKDGEEIGYTKLLIASGSSPFIPPIENSDAKGIFAIRTLEDLKEFKEYIKDKKKIIIIGGGLLGLEAAFSLTKLGLKVSVIESFPYILSRQLDKNLSMKLKDELSKIGINSVVGKNTKKILEKDGYAQGLVLEDGEEILADAIMIQAGVRSNLNLAKNSNLKTDRGICVDESLKTEDDDIFVAGDCAQIGNVSLGLWTSAQEMGKIAGKNMLGNNETYETPKPFTSLMLGDIKLFSAGKTSGENIEEIKIEIDDKIYKLFKEDNEYVGGILWLDTRYQNDIKKIVFEMEKAENTKLGKEIFKF